MSQNLSVKTLEENGYHMFVNSFKTMDRTNRISPSDAYKGTWQKCFRDEKGKRYFINISLWDFTGISGTLSSSGPSFCSDAQFNDKKGECFNLELLSNKEQTLQSIETFFEKAWIRMGCEYYEMY